ncbi:cell division protein FtsQ/DivIB [Staphylococcus simiae]|uniref:cell division protein FtsQ/DivIB n=1 Tax=Staphylococcus simiae TaxID=308354 RepID=UPI001A96F9CA|nr:cell division protein FtsQ/DivIB [Staphylococcus simiae]MBO1198573.1 cell division protein FtsQ/DivIB [Staphylococcus simiae]MBO1200815.1 cell division protein FtsQ/DivIB [Staphylococcus simiae]MBO1203023.1 cell division protein FtsQ/DivIB [Staphylococcus simiae]MBO1210626.1 cell division protein FtsQ/DivIB [Staphylococcus simiae]MBO1229151.1 cell division protein FtsQ/DivIB [Staphylococcus simiae]
MDDKSNNEQHNNNGDEMELFTRNKSKKRRQRKRQVSSEGEIQSTTSHEVAEKFDEDIYLINRDFKGQESDQLQDDNSEDIKSNELNHYQGVVSQRDDISQETQDNHDDHQSDSSYTTDEKNDKDKKQSKVTHITPLTLEEKRKIRRRRQRRIQYSIITLLILLIAIILIYMFSPLSKISHVNISGNQHVSTSQVNKILNVDSNSRMYTYSKRKAIDHLKDNPLIKDAEISKKLPNTLNVTIHENSIVALVKVKGKYVPLLESGKTLKASDDVKINDVPIIDGFKGDKEDDIIKALSDMSQTTRQYIAEVTYAPNKNKQNRIELFTTDGLQVVGDISSIANKMKYYPQMSQSLSRDTSGNLKTKGYIDLSVGASFIPYRGNTSQQSESDKNVSKSSQAESQAKEELQNVLNKINDSSKKNN